jgi:hypothetical protein
MTEAGPIEGDDAVIGGKRVAGGATKQFVGQERCAVKEDHRPAAAPIEVVQADAIDRHEVAARWIAPFRRGDPGRRICRSLRKPSPQTPFCRQVLEPHDPASDRCTQSDNDRAGKKILESPDWRAKFVPAARQ